MGCLCSSKQGISTKAVTRSISFTGSSDQNDIHFDGFSTIRNFHSEYKVLKDSIGSGLFGEVRICHQLSTNKVFAVKIISKAGLPSDCVKKKQVSVQVKIMQNLEHPCIVKILDFFEDACSFYLVMEYVKGPDLLAKLEECGRFNEKEAAKVMKQILSALAYMHTQNIVHRDIKCDNILLEPNEGKPIVKLIDFDTVTKLNHSKKIKGVYGTVYYMAPELIEGLYNEKCDVWSSGIVLYSMITKTFPYGGGCDEIIMRNILNTDINFEALKIWRASDQLIDFLKQLLIKNPSTRISAKAACSHPWIQKHCKISVSIPQPCIQELNFSNYLSQTLKIWAIKNVIPTKELAKYHMLFIDCDKDFDGAIDKTELRTVFKDENLIDKLMKVADWNSKGVLKYFEFLSLIMRKKTLLKYSAEIAKGLDKESSGTISLNSLISFLEYSLEGQMEMVPGNQNNNISVSEIIELISLY